MSLRVFLDKATDATLTDTTTGGTSLAVLNNRNPGDTYTVPDGGLKILVNLGNTTTPISCVSLFGIGADIQNGTLEIKRTNSAPAGAGDWTDYDFTSYIYNSRKWEPDENCGYDSANNNYYQYWMINITPPSGSTDELGEICLGLAEETPMNFAYGRAHNQEYKTQTHVTIGGIPYSYQNNAVDLNSFDLSWEGSFNLQSLAQVKRWHDETFGGLYPLVIIPNDNQRVDNCYYCKMQSSYSDIQDFHQQHSVSLPMVEVPGYEAP